MKRIFSLLLFISLGFSSVTAQSNEDLMTQGTMLLQNGAFSRAVTLFRKVLSRDPSNFEAQFDLALSYLNWGHYSNAITEFQKAAAINPNSAEVWSNLAVVYQNMGKTGDALDALGQAVKCDPDNIQARVNLATVCANQGKYDQAILQYRSVMEIDGSNRDAPLNAAKCYFNKKSYPEAEALLRNLLSKFPNDAEIVFEIGNLYKARKIIDSALIQYRQAIEMAPGNLSYIEETALLLEPNNKKEAISLWNSYLSHCDDLLKKDEIQLRIDNLSNKSTTKKSVFGEDAMKAETREVKKADNSSVKTMVVEQSDMSNDLDLAPTASEDRFKIDLRAAAKKKSGSAK